MSEQSITTQEPLIRELLRIEGTGVHQWRKRKHLLDTKDITPQELDTLVKTAQICKQICQSNKPPLAVLSSKIIANVFYENSTRTRSSFELAARRLGATVLNLDVGSSSVAKGETLQDTGRTLAAMGINALVQRHSTSGSAVQIARDLNNQVHVINAGDGWNAHPTQGLLDYFTMREVRNNLAGAKVAILGDIAHSRVARSNIWLLQQAGVDIHVAGPPTLLPHELSVLGVTVHTNLEPAIEDADFIMVLRLQLERQKQGLIPSLGEYKRLYRLDSTKLKLANPGVKILHPGPINRDLELSNELADHPQYSLITTQVSNGVAVRMAVLYLLLSEAEANQ